MKHLSASLTLCLVFMGACDAKAPPAPEGSADEANAEHAAESEHASEPKAEAPALALEGTHVVVAAGSQFFASADASEPLRSRGFSGDPAHEGVIWARHLGWVMKLGAQQEERVQVSLLPGDEPKDNCGFGMEGIDAFALTMWVERSALLPVTTESGQLRFADGSSVWLPPGIPILPATEEKGRWLSAWGFELELEGAELVGGGELALGLGFVPGTRAELDTRMEGLEERALQLAGAPLQTAHFFTSEAQAAMVTREDAGKSWVRIRGRCIDVEAQVIEGGSLGLGSLGMIGHGGGGYGPREMVLLSIPAGTIVHWPDGSEAGSVRRDLRVLEPSAPGKGECIYVSAGNGARDLALCFDPEAVERLRRGHAEFDALEVEPEPERPERTRAVLRQWVGSLRESCLSYALERSPRLDVSWRVRVRVGSDGRGSEPVAGQSEVSLKSLGGKSDKQLSACVREQMGAWYNAQLLGQELRFELRLAARR